MRPLRPCRAYYVIDSTGLGDLPPGFTDNGDDTATSWLWSGFVSDIEGPQGKASPFSVLQGVDLFEQLSHEYPVITATGATTTGNAIGVVLAAIGWSQTGLWSLATGDPIPNFSSDGSKDALSLITDLLAAEGGTFFIAKDGTATYIDYQGSTTLKAAIKKMNVVRPGVAIDNVGTRARVTRTDASGQALGPEQAYIDIAAAGKYGNRDVSGTPLSTPYLVNEAQGLALARRLVNVSKDPRSPVWDLTLQRDTDASLYLQMLGLDVGDRISIGDPSSGTGGDYTIEGLKHDVSEGTLAHTTTWVLRERPTGIFTIGVSVIGGPDTLGA